MVRISTESRARASFPSMNGRAPVDSSAILFKGAGTWDAIAIAVAGMAPTMAMNLNPQEPAEHVGRVVPLVFALSTFVVLLVVWCFARLAHHHPNAGSAYGFVGAVLGPRADQSGCGFTWQSCCDPRTPPKRKTRELASMGSRR